MNEFELIASHDGFIRRQVAREAGDEFKFIHSVCVSRIIKFTALNKLCAAMGASKPSVRS